MGRSIARQVSFFRVFMVEYSTVWNALERRSKLPVEFQQSIFGGVFYCMECSVYCMVFLWREVVNCQGNSSIFWWSVLLGILWSPIMAKHSGFWMSMKRFGQTQYCQGQQSISVRYSCSVFLRNVWNALEGRSISLCILSIAMCRCEGSMLLDMAGFSIQPAVL